MPSDDIFPLLTALKKCNDLSPLCVYHNCVSRIHFGVAHQNFFLDFGQMNCVETGNPERYAKSTRVQHMLGERLGALFQLLQSTIQVNTYQKRCCDELSEHSELCARFSDQLIIRVYI